MVSVLLALSATLATSPAPPIVRPDIVLITLDTTRADHLGAWGWPHADTPNLDRLATRGSRFVNCDASAPLTLPSHATILTGLYPPRHGVRDNGTFRLGPEMVSVAEILGETGYDTAAVVSAMVLARRFGLDQGFAAYDDDLGLGYAMGTVVGESHADHCTDRALQQVNGLRHPFFLWVHYFDPHEDYRPPSRHAGSSTGPHRLYDGEIAFMDAAIGRLLAALDDSTLVLVVGDHGEMLGEHGEPSHGVLLNRAARRVPLILAGPGVPGGRQIEALVRTADVMPTLLDIAGLGVPGALDGESLLPMLEVTEPAGRITYSESFLPFFSHRWYPMRTVSTDRWLYVDAPEPSLYDLTVQHGELVDVATDHPGTARQLAEMLDDVLARSGEELHGSVASAGQPSAEERRQLAALGYLGSSAGGEVRADLPDPRHMMDLVEALHVASVATQQGRCDEALPRLLGILEKSPRSVPALNMAGLCLRDTGKLDQAADHFERAVREDPRAAAPLANLASCLLEQGRTAEASRSFRRVLELDPTAHESAIALSRLLRSAGSDAGAARALDEALDAGGRHPKLLFERGLLHARAGELEAALESFRKASRRDPTNPGALENAARTAYQLELFAEAARLYEQLLRVEPAHGPSWKALGAIYLHHLDDGPAALRCFRQALQREFVPAEQEALREIIVEIQRAGS